MSKKFTYLVFGLPIVVWSRIARGLRLLRVYGEENIPQNPERMMFVANHPSKLAQPLLLLGLFAKYFKQNPEKYVPRIAADIDNFVRHPVFRLTGASRWLIAVNRREKAKDTSLRVAQELANAGLNQLWFPGGTRDRKARITVESSHGKSMGAFKVGFAKIALENELSVVPIWYERKLFVVYILIGTPQVFKGQTIDQIICLTEHEILTLADTVP